MYGSYQQKQYQPAAWSGGAGAEDCPLACSTKAPGLLPGSHAAPKPGLASLALRLALALVSHAISLARIGAILWNQ